MTRFFQASKAEFIKVFSTKSWWIIAIIMFLYIAFTAGLIAGMLSLSDEMATALSAAGSDSVQIAPMIYGIALSVGFVFPLLVGALSVTAEYRYHTIVPTFLTVAKRPIALVAKLWTQFLFGLLFGVIAFVASILASVFFLAGAGIDTGLSDPETWLGFLRSILTMALWSAIGVGVGSIIPNQAAVLIIIIGFTQFLEPILRAVSMLNETAATIGQFLPGAVSDAVGGSSFYSMTMMGGSGTSGSFSLSWWGAGLIMLAYALVASLIGYWVRWSRDVN